MKIIGKRIYLKVLTAEDDLTNYLRWMNDPDVVRFTERKGRNYVKKDLEIYIESMRNKKNYLFGIFMRKDGQHIGNIKLGNINSHHKRADIGIIIGKKDVWGHGFGYEAIEILTDYAFKELNLKTVYAGMYVNNIGSFKAFLKSGFSQMGVSKESIFFEGDFIDGIIVEKVNGDYKKLKGYCDR